MNILKKISVIIIILLLTVGCSSQTNETTEKVDKINVEQEEHDYVVNVYTTGLLINLSSLENIQMCTKASEIWSASISLGRDFDNELVKLYKEAENKGVIKDLTDDKKSIDTLMNKLNNPPERYQKLYDKLLEFYGEYTLAYELAISPNGSLMTYNKTINESYSEIVRLNNEFKVLIPQEIIEKQK